MARFRFNLDTLLRHREDLEDDARDELMRRNYREQLERLRLDELRAKYAATLAEMAEKQTENPLLRELLDYGVYLRRLDMEMELTQQKLSRLRTEVEEQKRVLIEASKKRKTLSVMRDKKHREFTRAEEKTMQQEVDELVVLRYRLN